MGSGAGDLMGIQAIETEKAQRGPGPTQPYCIPLFLSTSENHLYPSSKQTPKSQIHSRTSILILLFCFPLCMWIPVSSSDLTCPALLSLLFCGFFTHFCSPLPPQCHTVLSEPVAAGGPSEGLLLQNNAISAEIRALLSSYYSDR